MRYLYIAAILSFFYACSDVPVGFLNLEKAEFAEDSLLVRKQLTDSPKDQKRRDNNIPWVSYTIEGVEGTQPMYFSLEKITNAATKEIEDFSQWVKMRGDGALEVALQNEIPVGEYPVVIRVTNQGYSKLVEGKIRIVVE